MKISVITAVRNNRDTVAQALDSLLAQTHRDVELIVIDGASTDGTLNVLARYATRLAVLVSEDDHGIYDALNKGLRRATGDVIGFLHADDLLADNEVLSRVASCFAETGADGVYGDLVYVSKFQPDRIIRNWRSKAFAPGLLANGWMPPHPTLYLKRTVYEQYGLFDTSYRIAADYDFMLRVLREPGLRFVYLPRLLVRMRVGGASNRSLANLWKKSCEDLRALKHNRIGGIWSLLCKNFSKLPQFFQR